MALLMECAQSGGIDIYHWFMKENLKLYSLVSNSQKVKVRDFLCTDLPTTLIEPVLSSLGECTVDHDYDLGHVCGELVSFECPEFKNMPETDQVLVSKVSAFIGNIVGDLSFMECDEFELGEDVDVDDVVNDEKLSFEFFKALITNDGELNFVLYYTEDIFMVIDSLVDIVNHLKRSRGDGEDN